MKVKDRKSKETKERHLSNKEREKDLSLTSGYGPPCGNTCDLTIANSDADMCVRMRTYGANSYKGKSHSLRLPVDLLPKREQL